MYKQIDYSKRQLADMTHGGYRIPFNEAGKGLNNAAFDKVGLNGQGVVINAPTVNAQRSDKTTVIKPPRRTLPNFEGRVGESDKFSS